MKAAPHIVSLGIALMPTQTGATAAYVADNHEWELACNPHGYVLTSRYPVARFIEAGASSSATNKRETIYLGRKCDASHELFGDGSWCRANGGFQVEFERHRIGFPRQELICSPEQNDIEGCGC